MRKVWLTRRPPAPERRPLRPRAGCRRRRPRRRRPPPDSPSRNGRRRQNARRVPSRRARPWWESVSLDAGRYASWRVVGGGRGGINRCRGGRGTGRKSAVKCGGEGGIVTDRIARNASGRGTLRCCRAKCCRAKCTSCARKKQAQPGKNAARSRFSVVRRSKGT